MRRMGHLRALGLVCLLAGCNGGGDDTGDDTTGTSPGTGTSTSDGTTGSSTEPTPTTGDDTTGPTPTTGTSDVTTGPEPTTGDSTTGGSGVCDPAAQDCPPGSKCTSYAERGEPAWTANKCVPEAADAKQLGETCEVTGEDEFSGIDNCAAGGICLYVDDELKNGFCVGFCDADVGECPSNEQICIPANDGALPVCLETCDPLLQDCPGGGCYGDPSGPPFVCFFEDPVGGGMDGDPCSFANACLKGLNCTDKAVKNGCTDPEPGCCSPFCELDGMGQCQDPEECTPFFPMEYPGFENLGICTLPG